MDPQLQRRVQRYGWDKAEPYYEQYWGRQLEPAQTRMLELARLQIGERVLDVACGTGLVTFRAARSVGATGSVVATDISEGMVTRLRQVAAAQRLPQVTAERMDAEELRFPDASFDVVLCGLGLMYLPDPLKSLREMWRILKPGGRAAAAVWGARNHCGWADIFPIVERRVRSEVCPLFFQLGTGDALRYSYETAGFGEVATDRVSTTLHYDSGADACGAAFAGGPVALAYSRFDDATREGAHTEYLESIRLYRRGEAYAIPGEFVVGVGLRPFSRGRVP